MFKVLDKVCTPQRATKYSAYVDLFAKEDTTIGAGETRIVPLGIKIDLEGLEDKYLPNYKKDDTDFSIKLFNNFMKSHYLEVALRSSLGVKGLIINNGIGIIDLDYPDEIGLIVHYPINYDQTEFIACQEASWDGGDRRTPDDYQFNIKKGDKVAQCTLKEHKGYLMGYESDVTRTGGFGSSGTK